MSDSRAIHEMSVLLENKTFTHDIDERSNTVIFLYKAEPEAIIDLVSEFIDSRFSPNLAPLIKEEVFKFIRLENIPGTNIHYCTVSLPADLRTEYRFRKDNEAIDWDKEGEILEMPDKPPQPYIPSREQAKSDLQNMKNRFAEFDIKIKGGPFKGERKLWVHLPEDYDPTRKPPYPLLILLDGGQYHTQIPTPSIMDNMMKAAVIQPTVTVLIENAGKEDRFQEYNCDKEFTDFLADFVKNLSARPLTEEFQLNITNEPQHITIGGSSMGGLAATYAGLIHPEVFGNVISMSGSMWKYYKEGDEAQNRLKELLPEEIQTNSDKNDPKARFYMTVGTAELSTAGSSKTMLDANRELVSIMKRNGFEVELQEVTGGHNPVCWQSLLSNQLIKIASNTPDVTNAEIAKTTFDQGSNAAITQKGSTAMMMEKGVASKKQNKQAEELEMTAKSEDKTTQPPSMPKQKTESKTEVIGSDSLVQSSVKKSF